MFTKTKFIFLFLFLTSYAFSYGQIFKTNSGKVTSLSGVERYNVIFEYAEELKVFNYKSEELFLEVNTRKKEKKKLGGGKTFKAEWYSNRERLFEPKFIQEFNFFNLKDKQITIAKNISDAEYTMVMKTLFIDPGKSDVITKKKARLEVVIQFYKTELPSQILYETTMKIRGKDANKGLYNRILSAYAELGRGLSKHLYRKS